MPELDPALAAALGRGDPEAVAALVGAGAELHQKDEHGYGALLHAVHNRDLLRDPRLLDLLRLLIAQGADLNGITSYQESALRVLSHVGRFDAVGLLLDAGADKSQLQWTPLIEAVALGSLEDVERLASGAALEERDWWERTPLLVALAAGDLPKAKLLRERGASLDARGRCNAPPLSYAINGGHDEVVRWLIGVGQDVNHQADFGITPLMEAVERADLECAGALIAAGADVNHVAETGSVLSHAQSSSMVKRLMDAGADPRHLSHAGHRVLCGLSAEEETLAGVTAEEFQRARTRRFAAANPERMREPFWEAMIRAGINGYLAARAFDPDAPHAGSPVWCAQRFGQSITLLPDGRVVQIAGEHEDSYDPDFCIYNDVFVHERDGTITIYGYPEAAFPPTDFHSATLIDDAIYVIGSLGYMGTRLYGETPVYRLDVRTFRMERVVARGEAPGWIFEHRAVRTGPAEIRVTGGQVATLADGEEVHTENPRAFVLDVVRRVWRCEPPVVP